MLSFLFGFGVATFLWVLLIFATAGRPQIARRLGVWLFFWQQKRKMKQREKEASKYIKNVRAGREA